jgi:hypothetical protein
MATAWGSKSWSIGEFGTGDENILVFPTGQSLTSSLNSVLVVAEVNNGWGAYSWGLTGWGTNTASPNVQLTGQSLTTSLNSVSFLIDGSVLLTGQNLSTALNPVSITGTANLTLTTNLANLTLNSVNAFPIIEVPVTAPGTPTTWGSNSWGQLGWGENIGLNTSEGNVTVDIITAINVTGQQLTTSLNSVSQTITGSVALTGQQLTLSLGEETVTGTSSVSLTGQQLTSALGTVDPAPDAEVTGIQLTTTLNNAVEIDIAVAALVFGQQLTTSLNSVTIGLNTPVNLTTNLATLSLGSISNKIDVTVNVTGFGLTGTTSQLYVGAWAPVNTGQSIVWTEVAA